MHYAAVEKDKQRNIQDNNFTKNSSIYTPV